MANYKIVFFIFFKYFLLFVKISADKPLWDYQCKNGNCRRTELTSNEKTAQSFGACQMFCGGGVLWPPTSDKLFLNRDLATLDIRKIKHFWRYRKLPVGKLITRQINDLKDHFQRFKTEPMKNAVRSRLVIVTSGLTNYTDTSLTLDTDESYTLSLESNFMTIYAEITAKNYFGLRHGLETLKQLIFYNDVIKQLQIPKNVWIEDKPSYPYRGVMLDTSRNYINKSVIMKTIEAMGMSKLNTLHWHITDQHSFPYVSRTWSNMSHFGAYSPSKVYTPEDIQEIKEFGIYHGVRVLPELDAPAHVSEGWQWLGDGLLCYRQGDWQNYCSGPPCGQLNPLSEKVYQVLEGLYKDMLTDLGVDVFHMGGDQVNKNCWQSSDDIRRWANSAGLMLENEKFIQLWSIFQARAYEKLKAANGGKDMQVILWASDLTKKANLDKLDNKTYIIQNWYGKDDTQSVADLVNAGFRVIFSHYDVHYLDCGLGSHMGIGNNWCSPYNDWKKIWNLSPLKTLQTLGLESKKDLIFGGEVVLWSESVDGNSLDIRLWPRAAALAGRLWNDNPDAWRSSWKDKEPQMFLHRDRIVDRGISAQSMAPEWCRQNQGLCRLPFEWTIGEDDVITYAD